MTLAYVYKWTHTPTLKWYIGSRTGVGCHPDDGYICSSKIVKPLIIANPTDWIRQVLFTGDPSYIILLETAILEIVDAKNDNRSFNLHNGDGKFTTTGMVMPEQWRKNISAGNTGKKRSEIAKAHYRKASQLKVLNPEYIEKLKGPKAAGHSANVSAALTGRKKSEAHCAAMSKARKGKSTGPCTDVRKEAIREALKGKHTLPLITCPHCGLVGRANMHRWHFDNCKHKDEK